MTQADYEALKGALKNWRDILLAKTLRATGIRVSETIALLPGNMGEDGPFHFLLVRRGKKRGKPVWERVYLPPQLGVELRDYIRGQRLGAGQTIFGIKRRMVGYIFAQAGLLALGRPVSPHEFRGLYIKTLLDGGLPVAAAAKMVGHADPKTTAQWYYELTREQRAEIQRRIPV